MAFKRSRSDLEADVQKHESPFVQYGTPLPPLDNNLRDDGSYVPAWKQEVTDDRGRKRLHGAFTGGFSAGYYNTVGSKEGWTPSTFVSSRTNRAKDARNQVQQRPEDFMDDEDIQEQEESKHLSTTEGFAGFGTAEDVNHKRTLMDLFRPTNDTMGMRLLNKMGWKQGQGIGPKILKKADPDDDASKVHLFAPDDAPMLSFTRKTDHKGLGWSTEGDTTTSSAHSKSTGRVQPQTQSDEEAAEEEGRPGLDFASHKKTSLKSRRRGFGVGILNESGSDDDDPYAMGPRISYSKTLGGDKKPKKPKSSSGANANPLLKNTPVFISKKLSSLSNPLRKCHDGRLPLNGFVLANELDNFSAMSLNDEKYKPPTVPEGWKPSRAPEYEIPTMPDNEYQSTSEVARSSAHNSSSRGALLGESALPGKSVFDFLTPAAREKLIKASGKGYLPPALSEALPGTSSTTNSSDTPIPQLDPQTALQALSRILSGGFTPYRDDPVKAARYKAYLESQTNFNTSPDTTSTPPTLPTPRPPSMKLEDYTNELHEFARAAEVFKPVSGLIASRFTTSSTSTTMSASDAVNTTTADPTLADLLTRPSLSRVQDPAEEAAKMGMFGPLTRTQANFYPTRLLCKRFGVALPSHAETPQSTHPYGVSSGASSSSAGGGASGLHGAGLRRAAAAAVEDDDDELNGPRETVRGVGVHTTSLAGAEEGGPQQQQQLAIEGSGVGDVGFIDPDTNEALEKEKPGLAVFKAIFGSDDEDGDEDEY